MRLALIVLVTLVLASCVEPPPTEKPAHSPVTVTSITASGDDGNVPENTLDNDLETRWSAYGSGQHLTLTFNETIKLESIGIAWYLGDERYATYRIQTSPDGIEWTTHVERTTDTLTPKHQTDTIDTRAQHLRITGLTNTQNNWNSITSIHVNGMNPRYAPEEPREPDEVEPDDVDYRLIELSAYATIHDGPIQLVHDRRASGGLAVNAPWKHETFGGTYPSSETLDFAFEPMSGELSVWVRAYAHRENSAGWRLELPGGVHRTVKPDNAKYEWVEAYRGTLAGSEASLRPLGSRSSLDAVLITPSRDPSGFDDLLDLPTPGPVPDARYYVSNSGSDSASGSMQSPFRTIQKAIDVAQPGDTILIREGRYAGFRIIRKSGEPNSPITVKAYPGERAIIDSYLTSHDHGVIFIDNPTKHWVFDGFEITDSNPLIDRARALDIRDDAEYDEWLALDPVIAEDSIRAVRIISHPNREFSSHLTFQNLEIYEMRGTAISGNANHLRFLNNHFYDNGYPGTGYGWYTSGDGVLWDGNIVHDMVRAVQSRTSGTPSPENMISQNNLFYRNGRFTWHHYSSDRRKGPAIVQVAIDDGPGGKDNTVRNNIFLYNGNGYQDQTPGSLITHNSFIGNGILSSGRALRLARDGVEVTNNVFFDNRNNIDDRTSHSILRGNVETDGGVYRDPYKLDFTVVSGSPTIDTGVDMPLITTDFYGTQRPQGAGWDPGAVER